MITYTGEWEGTTRQSEVKGNSLKFHTFAREELDHYWKKRNRNRACEDVVKASFEVLNGSWWWLQMFSRWPGIWMGKTQS